MSQFDQIIQDVATRFGLGAKAGPLLREVLQLMTKSPGGISGFIDKFKSAGLSQEVSGWLGSSDGVAPTASQVEQALGRHTIDAIARKVGIPASAASGAIGYLAPKLVGHLTPDGVVESDMPRSVSEFLHKSAPADTLRPEQMAATRAASSGASAARWIAPVLALLGLGGLGWYWYGHQTTAPVETKSASTSTDASTSTPAPASTSGSSSTSGASTSAPAPASTPVSPSTPVPSRLAVSNDNGAITFSGTVQDQATRNKIIDALKSTYGSNIKGDLAVDPDAAPMPWHSDAASLREGLGHLKMPGLHALFHGDALDLGGTVGDADRDRVLSSLKSTFEASGMTFASADRTQSLVSDATNKAAAALHDLGTGFQTTNLLNILNKSIINFPTGSAEIPAMSKALLKQAATRFKQVPDGTMIQISGYTDNTGDQAANRKLSQERAEAVKNVLVQDGVKSDMLTAKGFGSTDPVASNDTAQGRFENRRIQYEVTSSSSAASGDQNK